MSNLKILFLDIYKNESFRINKDVNGGFGTGNNYVGGFFTKLLAKYQKESIFWPPIYLASSMGVTKSFGHNCRYTTNLKDANYNFDIFILSSSIVACETEIKAIKFLRKFKVPILVIGPFASTCPKKYIQNGANVLIGEPDTALLTNPEILNQLKTKGETINPSNMPASIEELPLPSWGDIFKHKKCVMGFLGSGYSLPIYSSRGCPYSCFNYCTYPLQQGRNLRNESIKRLVDQIELYIKDLKVKSFLFRDPVFTINRKRVMDICKEIIRRKIKIVWGAELHLKDIDNALANIMSQAGLRVVFVGIESINPESIKKTKRQNAPPDKQLSSIKILEQNGISVKAMFIFGFPGDNLNNALKTINYALKLPITYLQFSVFTPYPGTPIFKEYENKITAHNYEQYTQWDLVFNHENLTNSDIKYLLNKSYKSFYSSFLRLLKIFFRITKIELRKKFGLF